MGSAMNGMALHGGVLPVGGTFFVFSDYQRPAIRLAALSQARSVFVLTHDSVGLGEDGPTHQPVEHLAALRAIPGLQVIRPADANETAAAWRVAVEPRRADRAGAEPPGHPGGHRRVAPWSGAPPSCTRPPATPAVVLIGTGSEVAVCVEAAERLAAEGIAGPRGVDAVVGPLRRAAARRTATPCCRPGVPRLSVEAASHVRLGALGRRRRRHRPLRRLRAGSGGAGQPRHQRRQRRGPRPRPSLERTT